MVGAIGAAFARVNETVDAIAIVAGGDCDSDAAQTFAGETVAGDLTPGDAVVGGFVQAAARAAAGRVNIPGRAAGLPQGCVDDLGLRGVGAKVNRAAVVIFAENFCPGGAAIAGAIDAAARIGTEAVAERGDEDDVRVARVHQDAADLLRIAQADVAPGDAAIGGFVHAIANGNIRAHVCFAGADVDRLRVGGSDGDCADGGGRLGVENGAPGPAGVFRFPHAAVYCAEQVFVGLAGNAERGEHTAAAEWADQAPLHFGEQRLRVLLLRECLWRPEDYGGRGDCDQNKRAEPNGSVHSFFSLAEYTPLDSGRGFSDPSCSFSQHIVGRGSAEEGSTRPPRFVAVAKSLSPSQKSSTIQKV